MDTAFGTHNGAVFNTAVTQHSPRNGRADDPQPSETTAPALATAARLDQATGHHAAAMPR
jgi:hypothetical protein